MESGLYASTDPQIGKDLVTVILDDNDNILYTFKSGEDISLTIKDWLSIVGITMDDINPNDHIYNNSNIHNTYRITGVGLHLTFDYDNTNNGKIRSKIRKQINKDDYICEIHVKLDEIVPTILDDVNYLGNQVRNNAKIDIDYRRTIRRGITFHFSSVGQIAEFSFSALISAITDGVVLLNVAYTVTRYIAFYFLGDDSKIYKRYGFQETNINKELAQFSLQAAINAKAFRQIDVNNDKSIDSKELRRLLQMAFGKRGEGAGLRSEEEDPFSKSEINALVSNILSYSIYIILLFFFIIFFYS